MKIVTFCYPSVVILNIITTCKEMFVILNGHFQACATVVKFISQQHEIIRDSTDGKNVEGVLLELGTRLHRILYDHLYQFQYNSLGKFYLSLFARKLWTSQLGWTQLDLVPRL